MLMMCKMYNNMLQKIMAHTHNRDTPVITIMKDQYDQ